MHRTFDESVGHPASVTGQLFRRRAQSITKPSAGAILESARSSVPLEFTHQACPPPQSELLTADVMEGFVRGFLMRNFDSPQPIALFHRDMWEAYCSTHPQVAIAAPRGHAKSTAGTHAFALASVLFHVEKFIVILSSTWGQACEFLSDIKNELIQNEDIHNVFGEPTFQRDAVDDLIVTVDGYQFRFIARGSGQGSIRGIKWHSKRPGLILVDDLEQDEQVLNADRREKLRKWFFNAVMPAGSDTMRVRVVGTIMAYDALLDRIIHDSEWLTRVYKAHEGFDDFSNILWPEKFPEERLRRIRQSYINQGNAEGYSTEYLNMPVPEGNEYFRKADMLDFTPAMRQMFAEGREDGINLTATDLAISKERRRDYTVFATGLLMPDGKILVHNIRRDRWDTKEICDEAIAIQRAYDPLHFGFEKGHILLAITPSLYETMRDENVYLDILPQSASNDKTVKASAFRKMLKAHQVFFDKEADWWPMVADELSKMTESGVKGGHDDIIDAIAQLVNMCLAAGRPQSQEERDEEELAEHMLNYVARGRNATTGY